MRRAASHIPPIGERAAASRRARLDAAHAASNIVSTINADVKSGRTNRPSATQARNLPEELL